MCVCVSNSHRENHTHYKTPTEMVEGECVCVCVCVFINDTLHNRNLSMCPSLVQSLLVPAKREERIETNWPRMAGGEMIIIHGSMADAGISQRGTT